MTSNTPPTISEPGALSQFIQHTLIGQDLTHERVVQHLTECVEFEMNAAMIPGSWVEFAASFLEGTGVLVASAVDFPPAAMSASSKAAAVDRLVAQGADQIDIGTNVGFLLSGMFSEYRDDITRSVQAAGSVPIKVMLELPLLPGDLRRAAAELAIEAGAAYLKNASAGNVGAATPEDVRFLRALAPENVRVKASGAIATAGTVLDLLAAGASLVGTSHGTAIVSGKSCPEAISY